MDGEIIRILYVDDEKANLTNFKFLFQDDYEIITAMSAAEGLNILRNEEIHIVISDQRMPEITGVAFLSEVANLYPDIIRILLTAYTEPQDIIDAINIGKVYQYVTKPISEPLLKTVLSKAAEVWYLKMHNEKLICQLKDANEEYEQTNEELRQSLDELTYAQEKVAESANQLKSIANNLVNGMIYQVVINEDDSRTFTYLSESVNKFYGCTVEQAMADASLIYGRVHPDDVARLQKEEVEASLKRDVFKTEVRVLNPDGGIRWSYLVSSPNDYQGLFCWDGIEYDITEIKTFEIELLRAKEKAEESDRLKTAFLQNMSHEIRTPLNAICGFADMLGEDDLTQEKRKHFTGIIQNSSKQLLSIVTDVLTISSIETKQEKVNIRKVNVNNIILELLAKFERQSVAFSYPIYVKQHLSDHESEIYTDAAKLVRILNNLLTNAIKFTNAGFIEFGYTLENPKPDSNDQPMLRFFVKDTGIGIDPTLQEKIFERFRQADLSITKKYGGTGLGLSISKGLVALLGGQIWVESQPGEGSVFYFTIPYVPVHKMPIGSVSVSKNKDVRTILVAEDEEYNYLLIEQLLIDKNLNLIHAKNGREVVQICRENRKIDLVLMDIKMPLMDGHEAAKQIKAFHQGLPIIAQSAYALEHEIDLYRDVFDDYITKPIKKEELYMKLSAYVDLAQI